MKRWIAAAMCLLLTITLCPQVQAQMQTQTLEELMLDFRTEYGLNENNYSVSYYNTVTGESYTYNDEKFMVAASTFKLPLNMYYYEMERDGQIEPDAYIAEAGVTLDVAHRESLLHSNNEYSIGMLYHLGQFRDYKNCMMKYFTMDTDKIDYLYYVDNYYCTAMMMDALKYLYDHEDSFGEMLDYMKQAQPGEYFAAGVTDYPVAHKYGWFEGAVNDVGIIYTDEPFLLAVYTQDAGEWIVSETAALMAEYNVRNRSQEEPEPEEEHRGVTLEVEMQPLEQEEAPVQETVPEVTRPSQTPTQQEKPEKKPDLTKPLLLVAAGFVLVGGTAVLCLCRKKRK